MGKAVQHPHPSGQRGRCPAVVLLIQKETGFLSVDIIYVIKHTVFEDPGVAVQLRFQPLHGEETLARLHALLQAQRTFVALINGPDGVASGPQVFHNAPKEHFLALFHGQRQSFRYQNIAEAVHRQAGKLIRLPKDQAAVVKIRSHDTAAVVQRIGDPAGKEGLVKTVVGVGGEQPDQDLAGIIDAARPQIHAFFRDHIAQTSVFIGGGPLDHFLPIYPGVPPANGGFGFFVDGEPGIVSLCMHTGSLLPSCVCLLTV